MVVYFYQDGVPVNSKIYNLTPNLEIIIDVENFDEVGIVFFNTEKTNSEEDVTVADEAVVKPEDS